MNKYEILEKHPKLNNIVLKNRNKIKNSGGTMLYGNPHLANNNFVLSGEDNIVRFEKNAYARNTRLSISGRNNSVVIKEGTVIAAGSQIKILGDNNIVEIGEGCKLNSIDLHISGDRNHVTIGNKCSIVFTSLMIERNENGVAIGNNTTFHGRANAPVSLHLDEATSITIGNDCMISNDVHIMSTDNHSIVDLSGKRINKAEDIIIGDHCWICMRAICMKGTSICSDSVVGAASVVNRKFSQVNCLIAGNPARIVKQDINWDRERFE